MHQYQSSPIRKRSREAKKKHQVKSNKKIKEIKWNDEDRVEYLTGFRKRKLARKKKAEEFKLEMAKREKREERKMVRIIYVFLNSFY